MLTAEVPRNIPKQKRKRNDPLPKGVARHNPLSQEFKDVLLEQESKKDTKAAPLTKRLKKSQPEDIPGPSRTCCNPGSNTSENSSRKTDTKHGRK